MLPTPTFSHPSLFSLSAPLSFFFFLFLWWELKGAYTNSNPSLNLWNPRTAGWFRPDMLQLWEVHAGRIQAYHYPNQDADMDLDEYNTMAPYRSPSASAAKSFLKQNYPSYSLSQGWKPLSQKPRMLAHVQHLDKDFQKLLVQTRIKI